MPRRRASPHAHGRSEIWDRPALVAAIRREQERLGQRLRELREQLSLNQEEAAERIGLHAKTLGKIERGRSNVTLATLVSISEAYQLPMSDFFPDAG